MLIHLVADYGENDLAFAEVIQALKKFLPQSDVIPTVVPAFDTLSTGFIVGQLANSPGPERIIYHNTAPRRDDSKGRKNNEGEPLGAARVGNALVVGPNAGFSFSFISENIYSVLRDNSGSQFRSRDLFPERIAELTEEELSGDLLIAPEVPQNRLLYVDGYGNLKTSLEPELLQHKTVSIELNGRKAKAKVADSAFAYEEGELVLTPGSSGTERPYLEVFLRGSSAAELFASPQVGDKIKARAKKK